MAARKRALKPVRRRPEGFSLWEREKRCERLVFFFGGFVCLLLGWGEMDGWMDISCFFLSFQSVSFSLLLFCSSSWIKSSSYFLLAFQVIFTYTPSSRSLATRVSLPCFDFALTSSALGKSFRLFDILSVQ